MKVVFLDIDGVLNSTIYDRKRDWSDIRSFIDETRLPLVKEIVDKTGAVIVLSTTWRSHWDRREEFCDVTGKIIIEIFGKFGLNIYDKTPCLGLFSTRYDEIKQWLEEQIEEIESFVIIDDYLCGWKDLSDNFVKTDPNRAMGLESQDVEKAIAILNK